MASIKSANTNQYTVHFGGLDATLPLTILARLQRGPGGFLVFLASAATAATGEHLGTCKLGV